jgi:hypothetical protein
MDKNPGTDDVVGQNDDRSKTTYSQPTYPKYPAILKQSNIRYALAGLERQRQLGQAK